MRAIATFSENLDRVARGLAVACLALMVVLIAIQVVARYVFAEPPAWTEEGARYAMVWAGMLGASSAFRAGLDPVLGKLRLFDTVPWRHLATALKSTAVLCFLGPILYFAVFGPGGNIERGFLARSAARAAEALGISLVWFTASLPIAILIILIHMVALAFAPAAAASEEQP